MKKPVSIFFFFIVVVAFAQDEGVIYKGNEYYSQGKYDLAEKQYRLAPENRIARYNLANALIKQKKYKEAQEILNELSGAEQDDALFRSTAYYNTGVIYTKQKELEKSIEAYKDALRINPDDKQARENLQKALRELKQQQSDQQQKKPKSSMSENQAEEKLKDLEEKEEKIQQRMKGQQRGQSLPKDW